MSSSSEDIESSAIARRGSRCYELGESSDAALELLRKVPGLRVYDSAQARKQRGTEPFVVLEAEGFTIYKPWHAAYLATPDAASGADFSVGSAIVGRLLPTPRGTRLQLQVRPFAPAPARRFTLGVSVASWMVFTLAPVLLAGLHPVALALSLFMFVGGAGSFVLRGRSRREQDIRELLALVEGTFGPRELPAGEDAPHRRDEG